MDALFERVTYIFDPLHHFWEHERMLRRLALAIIFVFLASLAGIELNRRGLLPAALVPYTPVNHFHAVNLAFTLVLVLEVISLIFTLPCSFSKSVGKQFEILSLILLRDSFKELSAFAEPITVDANLTPVMHILGYGFGALAIFTLLGIYYRIQPDRKQDMGLPHDLFRFVAAKKGIALILLATFVILGLDNLHAMTRGLPHLDFSGLLYPAHFHGYSGGPHFPVFPSFLPCRVPQLGVCPVHSFHSAGPGRTAHARRGSGHRGRPFRHCPDPVLDPCLRNPQLVRQP